MDRLNQMRGEAGGSRDSTLDTTSPPSESFMTANESSSKYYSLSEVDSTFDISSIKDVSLATTTTEAERTITNSEELISNLSPIGKKSDILDSYKIDTQIEAANILSGGVAIFDENSYDGNELVIDDNVEVDDKSNPELRQTESLQFKTDESITEPHLIIEGAADIASKDTEVVLQIDGKNVDAIDIGNGLYLYRKEGQEELAAVQIIDDEQEQTSFKFLKVRENAEGNLEVYEEIEIEVPKEVPAKEGKMVNKGTSSHVPIKDINKVISESTSSKVADKQIKAPRKEPAINTIVETENKEVSPEMKAEVNLNGKMMKLSESRKSPVIGSFTPMTYHSTPKKEGIPLTKTMVDQQLHPNRHSDLSNAKKTIEVHTDSCKKTVETPAKCKDIDITKINEVIDTDKETNTLEPSEKKFNVLEEKDSEIIDIKDTSDVMLDITACELNKFDEKSIGDEITKDKPEHKEDVSMEQDNAIDFTEREVYNQTVEEISPLKASLGVEKIEENRTLIEESVPFNDAVEEPIKADIKTLTNAAVNKNDETHKPIAVANETPKPIALANETPKPMVVDDEKPKLMALDDETPKPIALDDETPKPMAVDDETVKPISVDDETPKSMAVDDETPKPMAVDAEISKPMAVDNETELTIVEIEPCVEESKPVLEDNAQIEHEETKICEDMTNIEIDVDEPIIVEDDNVSVVEVVVDSKNETANELTDSKVETKLDEENSKMCDSNTVFCTHTKDTKALIDEKLNTDLIQPNSIVETELENKVIISLEQAVETIITSTVTEEKNESSEDTLSLTSQNKPLNDKTPSSPMEIKTKNIEQSEKKDDSMKSSINDPKQITMLSKAADNIQNTPIESLEKKNAALKEGKHTFSANISPLLEQKQQSLITPRVITEKSIMPEKNEDKKPLPSIYNVTLKSKMVEHNIESKMVEALPRNIPVKAIQLTRSAPAVTNMKVYGGNAPTSVAQITTKNNVVSIVGSGAEIRKNIIPPPIKNISVDKPRPVLEIKPSLTSQRDDKKDFKVPPKANVRDKASCVMNIEISKVPKLDSVITILPIKQGDISTVSNVTNQSSKNKKDVSQISDTKPMNNNHAAVPFGKWTDANRQEFLNKFKIKTSVAPSNSNQLKNSNDLNRRDVLKKIDSQRQSSTALSKSQESGKHSMKSDNAAFSNKPNIITKESTQESKISQKTEISEIKPKAVISVITTKTDDLQKSQNEPQPATVTNLSKQEICQTKGNVQNLIDKTIEGMIHRNTPAPKPQNEPKKNTTKETKSAKEPSAPKSAGISKVFQPIQPPCDTKLDEIEMKMNELHGIPFIERPAHELPQVHKPEPKTYSNIIEKEKPAAVQVKTKIPNLLPFPNKVQQTLGKESALEIDSEEEIIEHEPITGDIDLTNKNQIVKPTTKEQLSTQPEKSTLIDASKKEAIITENDFDKFARRNSITYENRLTVNFDGKEPHNVVQTVVEKELNPKNYSRIDTGRIDSKTKLPVKYQNTRPNTQLVKENPVSKLGAATDDASNKNQTKLQKAYCSALTEKRQMKPDCGITIIENKTVQVIFVNDDGCPTAATQLDVQGQDLSPNRQPIHDPDVTISTGDSLDSDVLDSTEDSRSQDDVRTKTKHQRKQVLTPVEEPELELIEPRDLGIEVSPKKKRRIDEDKTDKNSKYPMRKKYLLGSSSQVKITNPIEVIKNPLKETVNINDNAVAHQIPVSALDSLVKAAELIETQTENMNTTTVSNPDSQSTTPVKRGRGRPRKYPLTPDGTIDKSNVTVTSPQKKPRLMDAITPKRYIATDDSDSDGELIKENWTMGKINENIVCPICNKLFRTENVVFKHVKHCTGPSPSRSDSDKTSPRSMRISQDSDTKSQESKSDDMDIDDDKPLIMQKITPKKRKSKDSRTKSVEKDEVIVIEDTPIKEKPDIIDERKHHVSRKTRTQIPLKNNLVCEICGKTFRQLSYLVSHKLQHKKPDKVEPKKTEKHAPIASKSVFSCEVCKKEFRKLHHLVQHRIIHNPSTVPARSSRKSSSEQSESKVDKEPSTSKQTDDSSAGFRCEPCDKSFRKLHHLVEHRETHDGKNRQKTSTAPASKEEKPVDNPIIVHQCDVCKKTFKKLINLNEHKEQHVETSSEKSDDKSVKSSLSTKDIIHECSLCYMVFPNEHSLNKHTIFCQRKKRQSKLLKPADETDGVEEVAESPKPEEKIEHIDSPQAEVKEVDRQEEKLEIVEKVELVKDKPAEAIPDTFKDKSIEPVEIDDKEETPQIVEVKPPEPQVSPAKRAFVATESSEEEVKPEVPEKIKKVEHKEPTKIQETPRKKMQLKDKQASTTKRLKNTPTSTSVAEKIKPAVESSDDDEVRYMLNPNFKAEEVTVEKVFMKVRAEKRSSLQIERPDSKDLMKRRTSLQHPPKIPRLKPKPIEINTAAKKEVKTPKIEAVPSTDSDDSDTTKYSFPATVVEKLTKPAQNRTPKDSERKTQRKSIVDKRKSLSGIAKRKSLGKAVVAKQKLTPTPLKQIKKRLLEAEHRCDCGQLFSSAALLSRHTSLAHTPPRIRRRRSPAPEPDVGPAAKDRPATKPAPRKSLAPEKTKPVPASRKSSGRTASGPSSANISRTVVKPGRKSSKSAKSPSEVRKAKPEKAEGESSVKPRRTGAHRGVPVPEKMRKLLDKNK